MKKKFHIVSLLVMLGFFLIPTVVLACETKSEKPCCETASSNKSEKKECCKNHSSNKDEDNSCGGKCGHSNCTASSVHFSLLFFDEIKFSNHFDFSNERQKYFHSQTDISSGFYSIWLLPKIS